MTGSFDWAMGLVLSKFNFATQELNPVKVSAGPVPPAGTPVPILLSQPYVNGVLNTLGRTQLFASNAAYQNFNNSKLFICYFFKYFYIFI